MDAKTRIESADPADIDGIFRLLEKNHLPLDGLRDHLATTLVARREDGHIVGSAALEIYSEGALLRSVAVEPLTQGQGLGHALTEAAIRLAQARHVPAIYLLTDDANGRLPVLL